MTVTPPPTIGEKNAQDWNDWVKRKESRNMTQAKHTPGPGRLIPRNEYFRVDVQSGDKCGFTVKGLSKAREDAALISAAPDLLEALESLIQACLDDTGYVPGIAGEERKARAAIAKAKGAEVCDEERGRK